MCTAEGAASRGAGAGWQRGARGMGRWGGGWARLWLLLGPLAAAVRGSGLGPCPVYPQLPNFDILKMTGRWFEVERSFYLMELPASCTELTVTLNSRRQLLITVDTQNRWTGVPSRAHGVGVPQHSGASSFRYKLNSRLPYALARLLPGAGHYQVLYTDYRQVALLWSCSSVPLLYSDRIWVLGRSRSLSAEVRATVYSLLQQLDLDPDRLVLTNHYNCTDTNPATQPNTETEPTD